MKTSILKGKEILAVDDETDVLEILDEELAEYEVVLDTASTHEEASRKLRSFTYDIAILDIMGVRGFDLLELAVSKEIQVVMLTAHALNPEALKRSVELGARAYLPKDQLVDIADFLEDVIELGYHAAWRRSLEKLRGYFGKQFGAAWRKSEKEFLESIEKGEDFDQATILE